MLVWRFHISKDPVFQNDMEERKKLLYSKEKVAGIISYQIQYTATLRDFIIERKKQAERLVYKEFICSPGEWYSLVSPAKHCHFHVQLNDTF